GNGGVRLSVRVSAEHLAGFRRVLATYVAAAAAGTAELDVSFSIQVPATDTLALDAAGEPFRGDDDGLVLRPSGHGALLGNLAGVAAPVAMIKNIDNVAAQPYRAPTLEWTRAIVGRLCELRAAAHGLVRRLGDARDGDAGVVAGARRWLAADRLAAAGGGGGRGR